MIEITVPSLFFLIRRTFGNAYYVADTLGNVSKTDDMPPCGHIARADEVVE